MKYTIDASNRTVGRVAAEAAAMLAGKSSVSYARNKVADIKVEISNASKLRVTGRKLHDAKHQRYSGFPGGLKSSSLAQVVAKDGYREILRKAVYGMLPINKLRTEIMKNIVISE